MNHLESFNNSLYLRINGAGDSPQWLVNTALVIGEWLIYLVPLLLLAMWLWGSRSKREVAGKALVVAMIGVGLNQLIGVFWEHPRPFMVGLGHTWISHAPDSSFPSDHMTVLASVGLSMLFDGALWLGLLIMSCAIGVAWARVFLGVHLPLDMVGSMIVAALSCITVVPLWRGLGEVSMNIAETLFRAALARPISRKWIQG
jgi:undecaprenyl-diphosphatase